MLLGGNIVTGCIISWIMIGRPVKPHQWLANFLAIAGFILAGYSTVYHEIMVENPDFSKVLLGVFLILCALITRGVLANSEEIIFMKFAMNSCRATAVEGTFGTIWVSVYMVIFSFVECAKPDLCSVGGGSRIQLGQSWRSKVRFSSGAAFSCSARSSITTPSST